MAKIGEVTSLGNLVNTDYDDREIKRGEVYYVDLEDIGYTTKHIQSKLGNFLLNFCLHL